jgi:hypothetical protein
VAGQILVCAIDKNASLLTQRSNKGIVYVACYVDDIFGVGHEEAINEIIELIKKHGLKIKVQDKLTDYLSCNILFNQNNKSIAWLGQPHLIKNIERKFGSSVETLHTYQMPAGTPGNGVVRPQEGDAKVSTEDQAMYRSGVRMLLYLVVLRYLSKMMDGATPVALKGLKRVMKVVFDTRTFDLKIEPKKIDHMMDKWDMVIYTNSNYAGCMNTRISMSGYTIFLLGVPILWKSKAQRSVTLSSAEAEFVACAKAAKEIKFVAQILKDMGIKVESPIIVRVDNVGAIFMTENVSTSRCTKHIDVHHHYVREFVEEGFICEIGI